MIDVQLLTHSPFSSQMDQVCGGREGKMSKLTCTLRTNGNEQIKIVVPQCPRIKGSLVCLSWVPLVQQTYIELLSILASYCDPHSVKPSFSVHEKEDGCSPSLPDLTCTFQYGPSPTSSKRKVFPKHLP